MSAVCTSTLPGSALYLHIPFCVRKCPYCDFYSLPLQNPVVPDTYVDALCVDIQRALPAGASLRSVFIGGGTPSLLNLIQVERIVAVLQEVVQLDPGLEFSMEVNPATVASEWLEGVCALGVNRLSIGVQSFQDEALSVLGRTHTGADALRCIERARSAGFININVDMMFALPGVHDPGYKRAWMEADQHMLSRLIPEHVSVYGLTLEPGTPFGVQAQQGRLAESDEEEFRHQFIAWHQTLQALGYCHYEISNYARAGWECRHNLAYWQRRTCYACGASAHAFNAADWGVRSACAPDVGRYVTAVQRGEDPRHEVERFDAHGAMAEWVYLRLRTAHGVDAAAFHATFGVEFARVYADAIRACGPALHQAAGRWYFPPQEWLLYNHHVREFLS
ncbi:MAG: radical SAM family heme chaperone HemW [Desulfuromonadaceae bacterium]|nr:radical SAM family heme chaperone HemW [Geobacteraceae bacterium]